MADVELRLAPPPDLLDELGRSLTQLAVAEEELRQQNEELRETRSELERERERYEDLFEFAPVAYLVTDANGAIADANDQAALLLNVEGRFLVGKPLATFVDPQDRREFRRRFASVAGGVMLRDEWELRLRPRRRSPFHAEAAVRASRLQAPQSDLRWMIRDVGERRRQQRELERRVEERTSELNRERLRLTAVVDQIPVGLVLLDAQTDVPRLANARALAMLDGMLPVGTEMRAPAYAADGAAYTPDRWPVARSLRAGEVARGEIASIELADGSQRLIAMDSTPMRRKDGTIAGAILLFEDVTAREQRERAEREFVANAAHELQTPLAAIASAVEVLQAGAKEIPRDRDLFLAHIEDEADRLARLARALLILAQTQEHGERPPAKPTRLRPLMAEAAFRLRTATGVEVRITCGSRLSAMTSRELLEHALGNLATNAAKYTEGGAIELVCRRGDDGMIVIEVRDSGPGIPPEERDRVRRRFARGGARDRSGFGLGLAIADQAARALGGSLELDTTPGGGTTARLLIPDGDPRP